MVGRRTVVAALVVGQALVVLASAGAALVLGPGPFWRVMHQAAYGPCLNSAVDQRASRALQAAGFDDACVSHRRGEVEIHYIEPNGSFDFASSRLHDAAKELWHEWTQQVSVIVVQQEGGDADLRLVARIDQLQQEFGSR